jgi:hypothetical protein
MLYIFFAGPPALTSVEETESSMLFRLRMPAVGEACEGEGMYFCQGAGPAGRREANLGDERTGGEGAGSPAGRLSRLFLLDKYISVK